MHQITFEFFFQEDKLLQQQPYSLYATLIFYLTPKSKRSQTKTEEKSTLFEITICVLDLSEKYKTYQFCGTI